MCGEREKREERRDKEENRRRDRRSALSCVGGAGEGGGTWAHSSMTFSIRSLLNWSSDLMPNGTCPWVDRFLIDDLFCNCFSRKRGAYGRNKEHMYICIYIYIQGVGGGQGRGGERPIEFAAQVTEGAREILLEFAPPLERVGQSLLSLCACAREDVRDPGFQVWGG